MSDAGTADPGLRFPGDPPLVAILRGLAPQRAQRSAAALLDAGFRMLEVPLNRPGALQAIEALAPMARDGVRIGAGTVLSPGDVDAVAAAGGTLIVSPHFDAEVVARARALGLVAVPGVFTATEAHAALRAGARALKIFPADAMPPKALQALATVLPPGTPLWPVGGIDAASIASWRAHGATGFGIGGALFKPEFDDAELGRRAREFVAAWRQSA